MPRVGEPSRNGKPPFIEPISKRNEAVRSEIEKKLDHLTELWNAVEGKVLSMQPPRHIKFYFDSQTDDHSGMSQYSCLGLQRYGGKWRLCYAWDSDWHDGALDWRPVVDCSTEIRVDAAKHIEKLLEEVVKSGKEYLPEVDEAVRCLENVLGDV
jgi:hypothetical protein